VLLAVAACFIAVVWLTEIAGDPTDGIAFYTFGFGAAILLGIGLVVAASERRDIFGRLGLAGAIVFLLSSLVVDILGLFGGVIGVILMIAAVAGKERSLLPGLVLLGVGIVAMAVRLDVSDDAYTVFMPLIGVASATLRGDIAASLAPAFRPGRGSSLRVAGRRRGRPSA
jgi:hypothetical protein